MDRLCIASLWLIAAVPASAQETPTPDTVKTDMITVGAGIALVPDYLGSRDSKIVPVPGARVSLDGFGLTLAGNRGWADLVPDNRGVKGFDWQLGPLFNLNLNRSRKISDRQVAALGKIPVAIEGGVQGGVAYQGLITSDYDRLSVTVGYVHDVGGVHKSYVITPAHKAELDTLAKDALASTGYILEVTGFADPTGNASKNLELSQQRADTVVKYLAITGNVPMRRIVTPIGYGATRSGAADTAEAKRQERRVEAKLLISRGMTQ